MATGPKLAVILGAGASFDVCPDQGPIKNERWRPPIVANLFSESSFDEVLVEYPAAQTLMSSIRTQVRAGSRTFEGAIREYMDNPHPNVQRQVREVPLALHRFFYRVSREYTTEAINYSHLVNSTVGQGIHTAFVTLNYDTLLERSLERITGISFTRQDSYVSSDEWMLIKLHGSVDWGYPWTTTEQASSPSMAVKGTQPPNQSAERIEVGLPGSLLKENTVYYPAIVLPVDGKYGFVCPQPHIAKLEEFLAGCSAYLFIGCSGSDKDLFDFMGKNVTQIILGGLVTGKSDHMEVHGRFKSGLPEVLSAPLASVVSPGGFTNFLERKLDGFLAALNQYLGR